MAELTIPDDDRIDLWEVHEHPERPLDRYALICGCDDCRDALLAEGRLRPRSVLGLKTHADRIVVTAGYLAEVLSVDRTLTALLYVADDAVREIFVPVEAWLPPGTRWWSLTCHEDEERAGRRHLHRRVAKRRSARDVAAAAAEAAARAAAEPARPVRQLAPFADAVASARRANRGLLAEAAAWALKRGEALDLDVAALICAAAADPFLWSRTGVNDFLYSRSWNWCSLASTLNPEVLPETLWRWIDFLADRDLLDPGSDPVAELRKPLLCYGGLDEHGNRRPPDVPSSISCQCYVEYRGPKHGAGGGAI